MALSVEAGAATAAPALRLVVDFETPTKLYDAICSCDWDVALQAVAEHPEQAKTWVVRHYEDEDDDGNQEVMWCFLPIHSACARQPPPSLIQALLEAYPDGASCEDDQTMYALHYACGNQASSAVINLLLEYYPEASKSADPRGMLPIHYLACWGPSDVAIIDMILAASSDVLNAKDADGNTPLMLALDGAYPRRDAVVTVLSGWVKRSKVEGVSSGADFTFAQFSESLQTISTTEGRSYNKNSTPVLSSPRTVNRLRHDVTELKAQQEAREATWLQKSREHAKIMHARYESLKEEFDKMALELQSVKICALEKEDEIVKVKEELVRQEDEFKSLIEAKQEELDTQLGSQDSTFTADLEEVRASFEASLLEQKKEYESMLAAKDTLWESKLAEVTEERNLNKLKVDNMSLGYFVIVTGWHNE